MDYGPPNLHLDLLWESERTRAYSAGSALCIGLTNCANVQKSKVLFGIRANQEYDG